MPEVHLTEAMRREADGGKQYALVGGYFIGPAWNGVAYVDGNGPAAAYLTSLFGRPAAAAGSTMAWNA